MRIVMKFGGTSVATEASREAICSHVKRELADNNQPILVVSAMGRKPAPYATDSLLALLEGLDIDSHERDLLMSVGELISALVMAAQLRSCGIKAQALSAFEAGLLACGPDGNAEIIQIDSSYISQLLDQGIVPVITGFQAFDEERKIITLGRGGSDTSACAIGLALHVDRVDIYSDVEGVMSADPRVVDQASILEHITAQELFQMANRGSKIVHAPAAQLALSSGIAMRVRNTFSNSLGTLVEDMSKFKQASAVTAISCRKGLARVRLRIPYGAGLPQEHIAVQARAFRMLADAHISIDMATPFTDRLVFVVDSADAYKAAEELRELSQDTNILDGLAAVTLVGSGMQGVVGIMAKIAESLARAGVDMLQISDSETSVTVLVREDFSDVAVRALHEAFAL